MYRGQKPRTLSGYCQPRHGRVRDKSDCPFRASDGGSPHCARKRNCNPNKKPLQVFCGVFYCRLGAYRDISATVLRGKNRSKSYFIPKYLPKKFPNPNPRVKFAPMPLNSRNPPLFSAISRLQSYISNIIPPRSRGADFTKKLSALSVRRPRLARTIRKSRSLPRRARAREKRDGRNR